MRWVLIIGCLSAAFNQASDQDFPSFETVWGPRSFIYIFIRCRLTHFWCVSPTRGGVSLTRDKHPLWVSRRGGVRVFLEVRARRGVRGLHSCIQVYMLCAYGCPMRRPDVGMAPITLVNEGVALLKEGGLPIVQCTFLRSWVVVVVVEVVVVYYYY